MREREREREERERKKERDYCDIIVGVVLKESVMSYMILKGLVTSS